jgi:3-methyl-2-oxobutanoate hydroxymethyltransferase
VEKVTTRTLIKKKAKGDRIVALTAYDFPTARLVDEAGVDVLLVGDSLGMVILGYETTLPVSLAETLHHTKAVSRARPRALLVADMPFMSFQTGVEDAVTNAGSLVKEAGAEAVKLEGGREFENVVRALVRASIPVMGHLGLTPQSVLRFGGFRVQGRSEHAREILREDAKRLQEAGCFSIVLEGMPASLASEITASLTIPTIGIGAGAGCDGQVLVLHDMLGFSHIPQPKFVRKYADLNKTTRDALRRFVDDVRRGDFPSSEHCYDE